MNSGGPKSPTQARLEKRREELQSCRHQLAREVEELAKSVQSRGAYEGGSMDADTMFDLIDVDGDGEITREELLAVFGETRSGKQQLKQRQEEERKPAPKIAGQQKRVVQWRGQAQEEPRAGGTDPEAGVIGSAKGECGGDALAHQGGKRALGPEAEAAEAECVAMQTELVAESGVALERQVELQEPQKEACSKSNLPHVSCIDTNTTDAVMNNRAHQISLEESATPTAGTAASAESAEGTVTMLAAVLAGASTRRTIKVQKDLAESDARVAELQDELEQFKLMVSPRSRDTGTSVVTDSNDKYL